MSRVLVLHTGGSASFPPALSQQHKGVLNVAQLLLLPGKRRGAGGDEQRIHGAVLALGDGGQVAAAVAGDVIHVHLLARYLLDHLEAYCIPHGEAQGE